MTTRNRSRTRQTLQPGTTVRGATTQDGEVLADLRDDLLRTDPGLAASLSRIGVPSPLRWWIGMPAVLALAGAAVWLGGLRGLAAVSMLAVLGSPVLVALALGSGDGPVEAALLPSHEDQSDAG